MTGFKSMTRLWTNVYVRRCAALVFLILVLWLFQAHLKDLASLLWPTIVGLSVYNFRTEISALIRRAKRIGKEGAEFEATSIAAQIMDQSVEQAMKEVAPGETNSPYILQRVAAIRNDLNVQAGTDQQKRENLLTLRFAQTQQGRDFQTIWMNIFLSQLEALAKMSQETEPIEMMTYFETHLERVKTLQTPPTTLISFEGWSGYLARMHLITLHQTQGALTQQGRDFLTFSTQLNLPRFQTL